MKEQGAKNAVIKSTHLGVEDHGILTCYLHLDYGGSGQGFGGYSLDTPVKDDKGKFLHRVGTAFGMEFINQVLKTLGASSWEELPGTHCRVIASFSHVEAIGHILEDRWFYPAKLAEQMEEAEK